MDSFKGTSASQDIRFGDKEKKLLRTMKFPPELNTKVSSTICRIVIAADGAP